MSVVVHETGIGGDATEDTVVVLFYCYQGHHAETEAESRQPVDSKFMQYLGAEGM